MQVPRVPARSCPRRIHGRSQSGRPCATRRTRSTVDSDVSARNVTRDACCPGSCLCAWNICENVLGVLRLPKAAADANGRLHACLFPCHFSKIAILDGVAQLWEHSPQWFCLVCKCLLEIGVLSPTSVVYYVFREDNNNAIALSPFLWEVRIF